MEGTLSNLFQDRKHSLGSSLQMGPLLTVITPLSRWLGQFWPVFCESHLPLSNRIPSAFLVLANGDCLRLARNQNLICHRQNIIWVVHVQPYGHEPSPHCPAVEWAFSEHCFNGPLLDLEGPAALLKSRKPPSSQLNLMREK